MSLIGFWGFDDSVAEVGVSVGGNTGGRSSGSGVSSGGAGPRLAITPGGAYSEVFVGIAWSPNNSGFGTGSLIQAQEGATIHVALRTETDGRLSLLRGGTVLATSTSPVVTNNIWQYVELRAKVDGTTGIAEARVDGTVVVSFTGSTRNGGATGLIDNVSFGPSGAPYGDTFDDAYLCDSSGAAPYNTYLGDIVVRTLLPSGNGDSSGFLGSDGDSVDNYLLVDEVNSSANDYVGSLTSGVMDLYQMTDVPTTYDVLGIQSLIYNAKSDGGAAPTLIPVAKGELGTLRDDPALPLSTTYQSTPGAVQTTDPDGNPLTAARVNAMQVGMRIP